MAGGTVGEWETLLRSDTDSTTGFKPLVKVWLYIVGHQKLQNSLLASHLTDKTGANCSLLTDVSDLNLPTGFSNEHAIVLWDARSYPFEALHDKIRTVFLRRKLRAVLFNAYAGLTVEALIKYGVAGVFYEDQDPDLLVRGLIAISQGELWFPRDILNTYILASQKSKSNEDLTKEMGLTTREHEILLMIAAGDTNNQIAENLCISPHTVKTHVSNILRKINVPNRTAAANWARKQLLFSQQN